MSFVIAHQGDSSVQCKPLVVLLVLPGIGVPAHTLDVTGSFSIGGVLAGAMQCQSLSDDGSIDAGDECQGATPVQPEFRLRLTQDDEFFVKLGFATGNGLNSNESRKRSPFSLSAWAADL